MKNSVFSRCWLLLLLALFFLPALACISSTAAEEAHLPTFASQVGGQLSAFTLRDNRLFAGFGPTLAVLDRSDPKTLKLLGQSDVLPDLVQEVAIQDDYAYVADGEGGLRIIDISDPAAPDEVGHYSGGTAPLKFAAHVAVDGDYAYVAGNESASTKENGLHVIDISDPEAPKGVGFLKTEGYPLSLAYFDEHVYLQTLYKNTDDKRQVEILTIKVSDAKKPVLSDSYALSKDASEKDTFAMTMREKLAYVSTRTELRILDMDDPNSPDELGSLDISTRVCSLRLDGNRLYLSHSGSGMTIVDVGDSANPKNLGVYQSPTGGCQVSAAGDYAYLERYNGLEALDVSQPAAPTLANIFATPVWVEDVAVEGEYAYAISSQARLHVIQVSDPNWPELKSAFDGDNLSEPIFASGDRVYSGAANASLVIVDVADKAAPSEKGRFAPQGDTLITASDITVAGDYAYLAAGRDGLLILDIRDPGNIEKADQFDAEGAARRVSLRDDLAFLALRSAGLQVVDVFDPRKAKDTATLADGLFVSLLRLMGDYAITAGEQELAVVKVSSADNPEKMGKLALSDAPTALAVESNYAYLVDAARHLLVIDIKDRKRPALKNTFDLPCSAAEMSVVDDYLYIAAKECGVLILPVSDLNK